VLTPDPSLGVPDIGLGAVYPNPIDPPSGCHFHPRCPKRFGECDRIFPPTVATEDGYVECLLYREEALKVA
jgi:peptide/nickel transport system ATP-binding protein